MSRNVGWGEVQQSRHNDEDMIVPHRRDDRGHAGRGRRSARDDYEDEGRRDSQAYSKSSRHCDDRTAHRRREYDSDERSTSNSRGGGGNGSRVSRGQYRQDSDHRANDYDDGRGDRRRSSSSSSSRHRHGGGYARQYADSSGEDDDADGGRRSYSPAEKRSYSPDQRYSNSTQDRRGNVRSSKLYPNYDDDVATDDEDVAPRRRSDRENRRPRNAVNGQGEEAGNSRKSRKQSDSGAEDYSADGYKPKRSNRASSPESDSTVEPMREQKPRSRTKGGTRREAPASGKPPRIRTITNTTTSSSSDDANTVAVSKTSRSRSGSEGHAPRSPPPRVHPSGRPERTSDSGLDDDLVTAAAAKAAPSILVSSSALSSSQLSLTVSLAESDGCPSAHAPVSNQPVRGVPAAAPAAVASAAPKSLTVGKYGLLENETFFSNFADADVDDLISTPCPQNQLALASIVRSGTSKTKVNYFTMSMETEDKAGNREVLYARRQRHGKAISYVISTENLKAVEKGGKVASITGKLKANVKKDKFVIYDGGNKKKGARKEICNIVYTAKSWSNPRGLMVRVDGGAGRDITFVNALPEWDPIMKVHSLKFNGRATEVSVKNFKLVKDGVGSQTVGGLNQQMYLRMGKVGKHTFNIDFRAPYSPVQAFGIALSSFEG